MDNLTPEQRSYNMSKIRSSNTGLELRFFKLLKDNGIKHTKHPKGIFGKPDCMVGKNTLIFVDSDFWHGWHYSLWEKRLPKTYWRGKIKGNMARDKKKFRVLKKQGYKVMRIWGHSLKTPDKVVAKINKL